MKKFLGGLFIFLLANTLFVPESLANEACADPGLCSLPFKVQYKMAEYPVDGTETSGHFTFCKTANDTVNWLEDVGGFLWYINSKYNTRYMKESYIAGETFTFYDAGYNSGLTSPFAYRLNDTVYQPGDTITLPAQADGETLYIEVITNPQLTNGVKYLRCAQLSDIGSANQNPGFIFGYSNPNVNATPTVIYVTNYSGSNLIGFKEYKFNEFAFRSAYLERAWYSSRTTIFSASSWFNETLFGATKGVVRGFLTWNSYNSKYPVIPGMEEVFNLYNVVSQDFDYKSIIVNTNGDPYRKQVFIPFSPVNASQVERERINIFTSANNSGTIGELTFAYNLIKFHPLYATPCADDTVTSCDWDAPDKMICKLTFDLNGNVAYTNECCYGFQPTDM